MKIFTLKEDFRIKFLTIFFNEPMLSVIGLFVSEQGKYCKRNKNMNFSVFKKKLI